MVDLYLLFKRFPGLTTEQRGKICARRIVRFIQDADYQMVKKYDVAFAYGHMGLHKSLNKRRR